MKNLFFLLLIVILVSCKQKRNLVPAFESYPNTSTIDENSLYRISLLTSFFNLPTISNGVSDSLAIRFWPKEAFEPFDNMFEFRLDMNSWKGYHYCAYSFLNQDGVINHPYGYENFGDSVFVVKKITPKCGWDKFYDSLTYFQLKKLPTQKLIENFEPRVSRDGRSFDFEIATKNSYRLIGYNNPDSYSYNECQQIEQLVNMFRRQLGDDYYWPPKSK